MRHHYAVVVAVRKHPTPEICELTVPTRAVDATRRRLTLRGWETVFVLRHFFSEGILCFFSEGIL